MESLKCPRCGSSSLNQLGPAEYKCPACGTGFKLTDVSTGFVDVVLVQAGKKPIDVIRALRDISTKGTTIKVFDLATAKRLTETTPCVVVPSVSLEVGDRFKAALEKAGASVELKSA
jgi:ribosomal protein L7/L12